MLSKFFVGFEFLHFAILAVGAVGFFVFWARTRFWLPQYAHVLAALGLIVGIWSVAITSDDAPLKRQGPVIKLLVALSLPGIVYFFFVLYGGQRAAFSHKPKSAGEIADIIERFLNRESLYAQEWHDFVEIRLSDSKLDFYRLRCAELDPLVNCPYPRDARAMAELRSIVADLRMHSAAAG